MLPHLAGWIARHRLVVVACSHQIGEVFHLALHENRLPAERRFSLGPPSWPAVNPPQHQVLKKDLKKHSLNQLMCEVELMIKKIKKDNFGKK